MSISAILGIGQILRFNALFSSLKSVTHLTLQSFFGMMKVPAIHSARVASLSTPIFTKRNSSSLKIESCECGISYARVVFGGTEGSTSRCIGSPRYFPSSPLKSRLYLLSTLNNSSFCCSLRWSQLPTTFSMFAAS